jgi:surfeit locus 1 family protein
MKNAASGSLRGQGRPFSWVVLLATVITMLVTARLGWWQLQRAGEKTHRAEQLAALQSEQAWHWADLRQDEQRWQAVHHPVALEGQWRHDLTFFLDNRPHQGQVGFWAFTPLVLPDGSWVLVKRGWQVRDPIDPSRVPQLPKPMGMLKVQGRIDVEPPQWMTLSAKESRPRYPTDQHKILDNVSLNELSQVWHHPLHGVVLQTDPSEPGLRRDWPAVDFKVSTHWGYAFQWFALSLTAALLYVWYQWLRPARKHEHE